MWVSRTHQEQAERTVLSDFPPKKKQWATTLSRPSRSLQRTTFHCQPGRTDGSSNQTKETGRHQRYGRPSHALRPAPATGHQPHGRVLRGGRSLRDPLRAPTLHPHPSHPTWWGSSQTSLTICSPHPTDTPTQHPVLAQSLTQPAARTPHQPPSFQPSRVPLRGSPDPRGYGCPGQGWR